MALAIDAEGRPRGRARCSREALRNGAQGISPLPARRADRPPRDERGDARAPVRREHAADRRDARRAARRRRRATQAPRRSAPRRAAPAGRPHASAPASRARAARAQPPAARRRTALRRFIALAGARHRVRRSPSRSPSTIATDTSNTAVHLRKVIANDVHSAIKSLSDLISSNTK